MSDDFKTRLSTFLAECPDAICFLDAVSISRCIGSLLAMGISEPVIREWIEMSFEQGREDAPLLAAMDRQLTQFFTVGTPRKPGDS